MQSLSVVTTAYRFYTPLKLSITELRNHNTLLEARFSKTLHEHVNTTREGKGGYEELGGMEAGIRRGGSVPEGDINN